MLSISELKSTLHCSLTVRWMQALANFRMCHKTRIIATSLRLLYRISNCVPHNQKGESTVSHHHKSADDLKTLTMGMDSASNPYHSAKVATQEFQLVLLEGPLKGHVLPLDKEIIHIGRAEWCDLCLAEDRWISTRHCELQLTHEGVQLRDCRSRNGVFLAGQRIYEACLTGGAQFQIGESVIELRATDNRKEFDIHFFDDSGTLVGKSKEMRQVFSLLSHLSKRDTPVLLTGETGTGKSSIAKALHLQSARIDKPFIHVNCGALPAGLIESELFGHEKGAFTGADHQRKGYFEQAHEGTLFLDEIAELPLELQPKLLDVLERKKIRRLGGTKEIDVDFRLITATHNDLSKACEKGTFRKDLFYRLSVVDIEIPSLRQRPEDIPLLIHLFLQKLCKDRAIQLTSSAVQALQQYIWPGNVRQLHNTLERSVAFMLGNSIDADDLYLPVVEDDEQPEHVPSKLPSVFESPLPKDFEDEMYPLKDMMESTEQFILRKVLKEKHWNIPAAANHLSISRGWLYNRIKKYNLQEE